MTLAAMTRDCDSIPIRTNLETIVVPNLGTNYSMQFQNFKLLFLNIYIQRKYVAETFKTPQTTRAKNSTELA
jgi:hypothetical protein